ncbi:MAG: hypothetical protein JSS19_11390 [Proteobacteria bacterium]|nr:hypothetical protein [Pseudomonadota bacterium]MBS0609940.1 hypothetical protein [Pseudomonadota bacterium]
MHEDDNQILIPPTFIALYSDARERLQLSRGELQARYELCEDLACTLVEQAEQLYHGGARSEEGVLLGMHAALAGAETGVSPQEARWITLRLAELLGWRSPQLPEPDVSRP